MEPTPLTLFTAIEDVQVRFRPRPSRPVETFKRLLEEFHPTVHEAAWATIRGVAIRFHLPKLDESTAFIVFDGVVTYTLKYLRNEIAKSE